MEITTIKNARIRIARNVKTPRKLAQNRKKQMPKQQIQNHVTSLLTGKNLVVLTERNKSLKRL